MPHPPQSPLQPPSGLWTLSQRRALIALLAIMLAILAIKLLLNPTTVPDPLPAAGPSANRLADQIDPNLATEAQLAAIPTLGEKRAQAIVQFRDQYIAAHPAGRAFSRLSDLARVKGIGPATVETLEPYLLFSSDKQ